MRKLLWFTLGFSLAIGVGAYCLRPELYFYVSGGCALLLAACLAAVLRFPQMRIAAMLLFGCVVGFLWQSAFEANYLSIARNMDEKTVTLTVTATDRSCETNYGAATECVVKLNGRTFRIWTYHDADAMLSPGDTLSGEFLLRCTLPGCGSASDYNRSNGVFLTARPKGELTMCQTQDPAWWVYPARWRVSLLDRITLLFPSDTVGFAHALLLGDTDGIDYATETAFKISGIRHVIAVSGLHVSILFSLVYVFTARKKWLTALIGLPALLGFAALAGFSPSITRACIMHGLTVIALLCEREYDPPSALSCAVLCMLAANPWTVTNVGFQLSVACVTGILLFSSPIQQWLLDKGRLGRFRGRKGKAMRWLAASISVSVSASLLTAPQCALYFGMVSLVGLLTNLLTLWIISFIFYGIVMSLSLSCLFMPLGVGFGWFISWPIRYVLYLSKWLANFPLAAVYTNNVLIVFWLILVYVLLALFCLQKQKHPLILAVCAGFSLCLVLLLSWTAPYQDDLRMTVLDVGQGQCILLQSEGKNYLVDCGGDSDEAAADAAAALLLSQGIDHLDGLIITHYDTDHAAGAVLLLQRMDAEILYLPATYDEGGIGESLRQSSAGKVISVDRDIQISFGLATITLIHSENTDSDNESGLSVLFQRETCDILITGDRSANGERELISKYELPDLEVLIVGHHGSKNSTCRELLIKTRPDMAIISVGAGNRYGHPAQEVLQRLEKYGCIVYRTDRDGTVIYRG